MAVDNEYFIILQRLYEKSLILEDISDFHPVLWFYFLDSIAHIDYSLCGLSFNYQSVRNIMNMQYMRWRIDEEQVGDRAHFPAFINWLWQEIYDEKSPARYASFSIVLDPDTRKPLPTTLFMGMIEEFFSRPFLSSIYKDASLGKLFDAFIATRSA